MEARRQLLVVDRQYGLEEAGGPGGRLEVTDVRLGRADRHRSRAEIGATERIADARHLDDVADARRRAVALDHPAHLGRQTGVLPSPLHRQPLTDRIGRGDPLSPPVARAADAAQHGVDAVAVTFGVGQPLEHEDAGALTHHEAVSAGVEGSRAGGREGADLAELHEARRPHVAVDATSDGGVERVVDEPGDGGVDGGEGRCAGGVDHEVRPVQVEQVGDPAGHAVAELARHRVLGDLRIAAAEHLAELGADRLADVVGQGLERRCLVQLLGELGKGDAQRGQVVTLSGHRVAEHDGGALVLHRPCRPAVVEQGGPRAGDSPLLVVVHRLADTWRDRQLPGQRIPRPVAYPTADLGIGLVRRLRVGVVVESGVPALGRHLGDRVAAAAHVGPEARGVRRIGEDGAHADDGDGADRLDVHDSTPVLGRSYKASATASRSFNNPL